MVKQVIANIDTIKDSDWIRTSFMLSVNRQDPTKGRLTRTAATACSVRWKSWTMSWKNAPKLQQI